MSSSNPIAPPVDPTAAPHVLTAWDIPGLVHGFCGRTGGVSAGPFATFNLAGWVGDVPDSVAENWRRWHLLHPHLPVVRVRQVHGKLIHRIDSSQVDSARTDSAQFDSARTISVPGDTRPKGGPRLDGQRSEVGRPGGNDIEVVGPAHVGPEGDGMVTAAAGLALGIFTADCVPILMVDAERRIVAALHAGWRGTLAGIAAESVHTMVALGARPASIRAALGPSIGLRCFEVDAALAETFAREVPGTAAHARPGVPGKAYLNLRAILRLQLEREGLNPSSIANVGPCTRCANDLYFSRRGASGATSGLQLSFIGFAGALVINGEASRPCSQKTTS
jgi:purine-nucleoside/S-methyl-5'-thioadenosine phosphorylase / adenosine deaminase